MYLRVSILILVAVFSTFGLSAQSSYVVDCHGRDYTVVLEEDIEIGDTLSYTLRRFIGPRKERRINELVNAALWPAEMSVIVSDSAICGYADQLNVHPKMSLIEVHLTRVDELAKNGVLMTFVYRRR